MRATIPTFVWGLVLGLLGCDHMSAAVLPRCVDGMVLGTDGSGNLVCQDAPPALVTPPGSDCADDQMLATFGSPPQLGCISKYLNSAAQIDVAALRQHIGQSAQMLQALARSIDELPTLRQTLRPIYIGSTQTLTTGHITLAGQSGLLAANAICRAEFGPGAQMCTSAQLIRTVTNGKLTPTDRIAPAWIYMPTWHNPHNSTIDPLAGLADNCGGYTTDDDTTGYTGMAVEWGPLGSGDVAFRWHGGDDAPCSGHLPVACCQVVKP